VAFRQRQEQLLGVLRGEEQEAHVEQEAQLEVEAHVEQAAHVEQEAPEEEGAGHGEASSRSTIGQLNFNSIYIHFYMK
jgi:hypothetical protein